MNQSSATHASAWRQCFRTNFSIGRAEGSFKAMLDSPDGLDSTAVSADSAETSTESLLSVNYQMQGATAVAF